MAATTHNLTLDAHGVFDARVQVLGAGDAPLNLTGYTARASVKRNFEDAVPLAEFACTVDGPEGVVSWSMTNAEAAKLQHLTHPCVWDLWLEDSHGVSEPILRGSAQIVRAVTHA